MKMDGMKKRKYRNKKRKNNMTILTQIEVDKRTPKCDFKNILKFKYKNEENNFTNQCFHWFKLFYWGRNPKIKYFSQNMNYYLPELTKYFHLIILQNLVMSILTSRSSKGKQQQKPIPNLKREMNKFFKQFKQFTLKYQLMPGYELVDIYEQFQLSEQYINKIITIWKYSKSPYQIWWEYSYKHTKSLLINAFVMSNNRIVRAHGIFNINLTIRLFQRYSREIQIQNHFLTFKVNPQSGTMVLTCQALDIFEKLQCQMRKPNYIRQVFYQMKYMVASCEKIIQLKRYFDGQVSQFPFALFETSNLRKSNQNRHIQPPQFLSSINACVRQIDPNCPEQFQDFGSLSSRNKYVMKHQINFPESMNRIFQFLKEQSSIYERVQNVQVFQVLQNIFQSSYANCTHRQQDIIVKKIRILVQDDQINWKPFAIGGFGLLEKAFVKYELLDFKGRNSKIYEGQIVRKSDIKTAKIKRQKEIFSMFKNEQNANIMPHYLPVQQQYKAFIFSKFQPHSSLDRYLKTNKLTINLQTIMKLMEHAVKGLLFLKEKNIVHLDIKPNNIIVSKDLKAKISDFGEAFFCQDDPLKHVPAYTLPYCPIQIFYNEPFYTSKVDVYAIGVTLYKVVFGTHIWGQILDKNKFKQNLLHNKNIIRIAPQKIYKYGIPEILGNVVNLSLKCVNPLHQQRPSLFYISVIFSFCRFYLLSIVEGAYQMD